MPDGIKFSELQSTLTLGNNDLAAVSHDNGDSTYTSVKVPMTQLGQKVVNDIDYTQALNTTSKKPIGAINELKNELMNIYPVLATSPAPIANFSTDLALPLKSCKVEIKPKQASGTPTPSNPLPISGTDTITIYQTGANLWDEDLESGSINTSTGQNETYGTDRMRSANYIPVQPSTAYYFVSKNNVSCYAYCYRKDKSYIGIYGGGSNIRNATITTPSDCYFIRFRTDNNYGTTYANDFSLNYPSTDTTYHAHVTATTKNVSLPSSVYGGEVDVIGGSGKSEKALIDFGDQTLTWAKSPSVPNCFFSSVISGANATGTQEVLSSIYAYSSAPTGSMPNETIKMYQGRLYVIDDDYATADAFVTGVSGQKVLYPLATPTPITLANPIELTAQSGVNNVFGDTDGNTSVEFRESVQKYVDDNIAAVQALIL